MPTRTRLGASINAPLNDMHAYPFGAIYKGKYPRAIVALNQVSRGAASEREREAETQSKIRYTIYENLDRVGCVLSRPRNVRIC